MIKAIIVDDEKKNRSILNSMLQKYCPQVTVVGMVENINDAAELIEEKHPNLVLLDIEMPYGSGFELLKQVKKIDFEVVFVTGFDHYALQAIKFHALDYLLKPVDIDELILAIEKVEQALSQKQDSQRLEELLGNLQKPINGTRRIALPSRSGREFVPIKDIQYCEADGGCTWFYLVNGKRLLSSKNLGEYEKLLPTKSQEDEHRFFRTHHRYLVNVNYIKKHSHCGTYLVMSNGEKIGLAQRRKAPFFRFLRQMNFV